MQHAACIMQHASCRCRMHCRCKLHCRSVDQQANCLQSQTASALGLDLQHKSRPCRTMAMLVVPDVSSLPSGYRDCGGFFFLNLRNAFRNRGMDRLKMIRPIHRRRQSRVRQTRSMRALPMVPAGHAVHAMSAESCPADSQ